MTIFRALPAAIGAAFALSASVANAGLINEYDFNGTNQTLAVGAAFTSSGAIAGGPSLSVLAYFFSGGSWDTARVQRNGDALGVNSISGDSAGGQMGPRIEGLLFDLGTEVFGSFRLDFSLFTGADNTDIWASTTDIIANNFAASTQVANNSTSNPFLSGNMSFRYIFVASTDATGAGGTNCETDFQNCFRVDNLRVVPEPGSLALVGGGLLLAGLARRRRRAAR